MSKPFYSIEQQIELLKSRGLETDVDTAKILLCENYYSVVNGYKTYFLDHEKTAHTGNDVYLEGAKFSEIYNLFLFDRSLRETIFHYLVKAEAIIL